MEKINKNGIKINNGKVKGGEAYLYAKAFNIEEVVEASEEKMINDSMKVLMERFGGNKKNN